MVRKLRGWISLVLLGMVAGCYPEGAEYADELDLVYTNYNNQFNFSSKTTYAIPDSVIKITGDVFNDPDGDGKPQFLTSTYSVPLLTQIKQSLNSYGWTEVDKNNNPDVVILVSSMSTTNIYYYYDWSYWDWWYPDFYPWWGWYYPGYYYPAYVTGYRSGSVFIQMVDHSATGQQADNIPVQWSCVLNGLAEGDTGSIVARMQNGINAAFSQSPYLKH